MLRPAGSAGASQISRSVDGRGDVAAPWVDARGRTSRVRVVMKIAGDPLVRQTLLSARDRAVTGLTTVLDRRGELAVAWVDRASTRGLLHGRITVRAAYRTRSGRWSVPAAISPTSPFFYAQPRLAAAPDGTWR